MLVRQDIYQKRLVWYSYGQELLSNRGDQEVNGRTEVTGDKLRLERRLVNREMASRGGEPLLGNLSDWKCFGINFLDTIRSQNYTLN